VAPLRLRGIFTSAAAVAFCIGTLILAIIIDAYGNLPSSWAYKSLFLTQYGVTGIAVMILPFMPESPLWLISVGKHTQARQSLRKLGQGSDQSQESFAMIHYTLEANATETNAATYMELFRKSNLRRTIIALMPLTIQSFSGVGWVGGYFTYYAQLAGYSTSISYRLNICQQVLSTTGNVMSVSSSSSLPDTELDQSER
jgi:MFS family permease